MLLYWTVAMHLIEAIKFFSSCTSRNWSRNWLFLLNRVNNHNCFHPIGGSKTATTPTMEAFVTIVNIFEVLINFVKLSILDVCGSPGWTSLWWLYVIKSSILDISLDPSSNVISKISNIFHWIQILFIKYKYILLNINIFS